MKNDKKLWNKTEQGRFLEQQMEAGRMSREQVDAKINLQSAGGLSIIVERGYLNDDVAESLISDGFKVSRKWDSESGMYWSTIRWGEESKTPNKWGYYIVIGIVIIFVWIFFIK